MSVKEDLGQIRQDIGVLLHGQANFENWMRDEALARRRVEDELREHKDNTHDSHGTGVSNRTFDKALSVLNLLILAGTLLVMYKQGGSNERQNDASSTSAVVRPHR